MCTCAQTSIPIQHMLNYEFMILHACACTRHQATPPRRRTATPRYPPAVLQWLAHGLNECLAVLEPLVWSKLTGELEDEWHYVQSQALGGEMGKDVSRSGSVRVHLPNLHSSAGPGRAGSAQGQVGTLGSGGKAQAGVQIPAPGAGSVGPGVSPGGPVGGVPEQNSGVRALPLGGVHPLAAATIGVVGSGFTLGHARLSVAWSSDTRETVTPRPTPAAGQDVGARGADSSLDLLLGMEPAGRGAAEEGIQGAGRCSALGLALGAEGAGCVSPDHQQPGSSVLLMGAELAAGIAGAVAAVEGAGGAAVGDLAGGPAHTGQEPAGAGAVHTVADSVGQSMRRFFKRSKSSLNARAAGRVAFAPDMVMTSPDLGDIASAPDGLTSRAVLPPPPVGPNSAHVCSAVLDAPSVPTSTTLAYGPGDVPPTGSDLTQLDTHKEQAGGEAPTSAADSSDPRVQGGGAGPARPRRAPSFRVAPPARCASGKRMSALITGLQGKMQEAQRLAVNAQAMAGMSRGDDLRSVDIVEKIGSGGFGVCYLAMFQVGVVFAGTQLDGHLMFWVWSG